MGKDQHDQEPQPHRRVALAHSGDAQPLEYRRQAVAGAGEPEEMHGEHRQERAGDDPRLDRAQRSAPTLGRDGEQAEEAEQNERHVAGE